MSFPANLTSILMYLFPSDLRKKIYTAVGPRRGYYKRTSCIFERDIFPPTAQNGAKIMMLQFREIVVTNVRIQKNLRFIFPET